MKLSLSRTVDTRLDTRGRGKKYRREEKNRGIGEQERGKKYLSLIQLILSRNIERR